MLYSQPVFVEALDKVLSAIDTNRAVAQQLKTAAGASSQGKLGGKPKKAGMKLTLNYKITAVTDVDTAIMRYRCIFKLFAWWEDPKIAKLTTEGAKKGDKEYKNWDEFFNPDLRVINAVGVAADKPHLTERKIIDLKTGKVKWSMYFCTELYCLMDLRSVNQLCAQGK
jgi:hypothetical protein